MFPYSFFFYTDVKKKKRENTGKLYRKILLWENKVFWKDHKAAKINNLRIRTSIDSSTIVIVKFGEKYKQWNAAFDAGFAAALGKPMIILHDEDLTHALKEVDAAALAVTKSPDQVVRVLDYAINGNL